jgi:hypothetical protein
MKVSHYKRSPYKKDKMKPGNRCGTTVVIVSFKTFRTSIQFCNIYLILIQTIEVGNNYKNQLYCL